MSAEPQGGGARPWAHNAAQLVLCMIGSALLNVISQEVFAQVAAAHKEAWLSAALLAGTLASALGVWAARRFGLPDGPAGSVLMVVIGAAFALALTWRQALAFTALSVALRFAMHYATQALDGRAVAAAGESSRRLNDMAGLGMRFAGMLLGPLWFSVAGDQVAASLIMITALTALGAWSAWGLRYAQAPGAPGAPDAPHVDGSASGLMSGSKAGSAPRSSTRGLMRAGTLIYAAYYLLASSVIYVLADQHGAPDATRRGGLMVTAVYGSAIVATLVELARARRSARSALEMAPAALLMMVVGVGLSWQGARHGVVQGVLALLLGVAFARFQLAARDHATRAALGQGDPQALADYNNMANASALVGYAVMAALVGVAQVTGAAFAALVGWAIWGVGAAALIGVVAAWRALAKAQEGPRRRGDGS